MSSNVNAVSAICSIKWCYETHEKYTRTVPVFILHSNAGLKLVWMVSINTNRRSIISINLKRTESIIYILFLMKLCGSNDSKWGRSWMLDLIKAKWSRLSLTMKTADTHFPNIVRRHSYSGTTFENQQLLVGFMNVLSSGQNSQWMCKFNVECSLSL